MTNNYTRTGRQILDIGTHAAIRLDRAQFERENEFGGQGNLTTAWFTGGSTQTNNNALSSVSRIRFENDTVTGSLRGSLQVARSQASGFGNTSNGWVFGGLTYSPSTTVMSSYDRISFSNDAVTAQPRSNITNEIHSSSTSGNATDAWVTGGLNTVQSIVYKIVNRIIFANDEVVASSRTFIPFFTAEHVSSGNSTNAWLAGGRSDGSVLNVSRVFRLAFANDTADMQPRNNLINERTRASGTGNVTDMWIANGQIDSLNTAQNLTSVERIIFANDTTTTTLRGNTVLDNIRRDASSNLTDGWISGGLSSRVERITFANDLITASTRGPLPNAPFAPSAVS